METFLFSVEMLQIGQWWARSSWTVKSEETIRSSLLSTCVGACFISPAYFHIVPHLNSGFFSTFLRWSLVCHYFISACLYGFSFFFFFLSFFILAFCLALQEQVIKGSLLQGALEKKSSARSCLKWAVDFANYYGKTSYSFLFLVSIVWKESKVWVIEQKINSFEICFFQLLVVKETLG